MEITSNIHLINGIRGANGYLIINQSKLMVVDTGMPGNGQKIVKYINELGKNPADITHIILTHADIDHVGSTAELKRLTGGKVAIHGGDAPILSGKSKFKTVSGPLGLIFKLLLPLLRFHPIEPDIILENNSEVEDFQIIHAPGHTDGSICLYKPGKVIFTGDALRSDSLGNPRPPSRRLSVNAKQSQASARKIADLDFDVLLPGHGAPVTNRASAKVKEMARHLK